MAKKPHTILAATLGWDSAEVSEHRYQYGRTPYPIFTCNDSYYAVRKAKPEWGTDLDMEWGPYPDQFWAKDSDTVLWVSPPHVPTPAPAEVVGSVDITPVGLSSPAGVERVNKAMKAFEESHSTVANAASQFLYENAERIRVMLRQNSQDDDCAIDDFDDLMEKIAARAEAQEEFMRAVAGAPARGVN